MAANKLQIVDIFSWYYVAARLTHKNVSRETAVSGISKVQTVSNNSFG